MSGRRPTSAVALVLFVLATPGLWQVGPRVWAQAAAWKQADPRYQLSLPRDHVSHPDYRLEWWYYTGNVATPNGRRFGFQVTFFRVGVDPAPSNPSTWAVRDLFLAHLAVTDVGRAQFHFADRVNRAGVGWAGAATDRYEVWNETWHVRLDDRGRHLLHAMTQDFGVELTLEPGKPFVRHGEDGYSRKGSVAGNASHYYSLTRMPTRGRIKVNGESVDVSGLSWMDHEFGSTFLEDGQLGWDWFSVHLDDGTDVMVYRFRRSDGQLDTHSSGSIAFADGRVDHLTANEIRLQPGPTWLSPASRARYPVRWTLEIPSKSLTLLVRATVQDQELRTTASTGVSYWEGSVDVEGQFAGKSLAGRGYLEMTGYVGRPMSEVLR